jgi:ABC-type nitrate/sulfonate/bicarbonate transport system substrate-binding protein
MSRAIRIAPVLVALLACACIPAAARADDTLTIVTGSSPTAFFDVLSNVAARAGFYKDEHLTVNEQYTSGPAVGAQLVASGKGDICSISIEPIILGYAKGLYLTPFFSRDPRDEWVIAVLDDSPIRRLEDFKDTSIGEVSVGSTGERNANSMLSGAGLKKGDYAYIPIGVGAAAIQALTTKKVAGAAFPYPELAAYEVQAHLKFRYFWNPLLYGIGTTVYAATPATIRDKADQLRRFARANVKAAILIRENPQLAARYNVEEANITGDKNAVADWAALLQLAGGQLPGIDPLNKRIGAISPLGMEVFRNFLAADTPSAQAAPLSALVTNQFIAYANDFDRRAFIAHVRQMR